MIKPKLDSKFIKINFSNLISENHENIENFVKNSNILVIGGAGTIGSNYIKKILRFYPSKVTVVDINENALTELTRDLRSSSLLDYKPDYITYPVSLLSDLFDNIFKKEKWDIVANFAAHKHVRSEKDNISVASLIKNNVFGAIKLLNLCSSCPPKFFFSVSTDKAANPVNIMGASKLLMEKLILSKKHEFRVTTARFANVAFSNGSLLDGFIYRLQKKQPLSCPIDIKRFFVTPEQSGEICLLSTFLGESGNIFFPKLNFNSDQIYFKDIAINFLKSNNFNPIILDSENAAKRFKIGSNGNNYPILFFKTDTSGEKPYEEFYSEDEEYELDHYETLGFIKSSDIDISFAEILSDFSKIFSNDNFTKSDVIELINKYIPTFMHIETGKSLDEKM